MISIVRRSLHAMFYGRCGAALSGAAGMVSQWRIRRNRRAPAKEGPSDTLLHARPTQPGAGKRAPDIL